MNNEENKFTEISSKIEEILKEIEELKKKEVKNNG